jgi:hypothetical protein
MLVAKNGQLIIIRQASMPSGHTYFSIDNSVAVHASLHRSVRHKGVFSSQR